MTALTVRGLRVSFDHPLGLVRAVDDVSFELPPNERFGLVGESGSGKSTMALAIMRMIRPPGHIDGGDILLGEKNLSILSGRGSPTDTTGRDRDGAARIDERAEPCDARWRSGCRCDARSWRDGPTESTT